MTASFIIFFHPHYTLLIAQSLFKMCQWWPCPFETFNVRCGIRVYGSCSSVNGSDPVTCPRLHETNKPRYRGREAHKNYCNAHATQGAEQHAQHHKSKKKPKHDVQKIHQDDGPNLGIEHPGRPFQRVEKDFVSPFVAADSSMSSGLPGTGSVDFTRSTYETGDGSSGPRRIIPPRSQIGTQYDSPNTSRDEIPGRQLTSQHDPSDRSSILTRQPSPDLQQPDSRLAPTESSRDFWTVIGVDPHGTQPQSSVREGEHQDRTISTGHLSDSAPGQGQHELQARPDDSQARGSAAGFLHHGLREGSDDYPSQNLRPRPHQERETGRRQDGSSRGRIEKSRHSGGQSDKSKRH